MTEIRLCQNPDCGKPFAPKRKNSRYCCVKCMRIHYRKNHPDVFARNAKRWRERHPERTRKRIDLLKLTCPLCGNTFTQTSPRQKYCSTRCYRDYYRRKHPVKTEIRLCQNPNCGKSFRPKRRHAQFCSRKCKDHVYWLKNKRFISALQSMYWTSFYEKLEHDSEAYAKFRAKRRETRRHQYDKIRKGIYKPRPARRIPDYLCKNESSIDTSSRFLVENAGPSEMAFARELFREQRESMEVKNMI